MAYLKRLPVQVIKIDKAFIDGLERSPDSEAIVSAIVAMSHALGKRVIAEGVEKAEQVTLLQRLRCDGVQGFVVAPALSPKDFVELLKARRGERAAEPA
jgi:EAL domain-containing protein (putative c-di-GMP-specific phosphodiesterase class I)